MHAPMHAPCTPHAHAHHMRPRCACLVATICLLHLLWWRGVFLLPRAIHRVVTVLDMYQTYHLIHHLFPRIPFYRIGAAFHEMRPILEAEGAAIHDWTHAWDRKPSRGLGAPVTGVAPGARIARKSASEAAARNAASGSDQPERRANTN